MLNQERLNHARSSIAVSVSRRTQKNEINLTKKKSGFAFFSMELSHIFGSNVGKDFGIFLEENWFQKTLFAFEFVSIQCLMRYTELIEYNINGDTKAPLMRYFLFDSQLLSGDVKSTGQYKSYQSFSNPYFRPLLKNYFLSIHILKFEGHKCWNKKVFCSWEKLSTARQRVWEKKYWDNSWVVVVSRGESFQQKLQNEPVGHVEICLQKILVNHVKHFFCGLWKPWRESPSSWHRFVVPWTRNLCH